MKTVYRIIIGVVVLVVLVLAGLSFFVRYYLTGDRLQAMLVPPAEKMLGRDVSIGTIDVSLFKGITVNSFAVKEGDGKDDFISAGSFILRYDLIALLQKEVVVSEIRLEKPVVHIYRDKKGTFNFSSLAFLTKKPTGQAAAPKSSTTAAKTAGALPLALTVDKISVSNASLIFSDAKKELPDVNALTDLSVALAMGKDFASLRFQGSGKLQVDAEYQGVEPKAKGTFDFSEQQFSGDLKVTVQDQEMKIVPVIKNYLQTPAVQLNVSSKQLDVDKLLSFVAVLSGGEQKEGKTQGKKKTGSSVKTGGVVVKKTGTVPSEPIGAKIPAGFIAQGTVDIGKALYSGLTMNQLHGIYRLEKNVLTVEEFSFQAAGGSLKSKHVIDLNQIQIAYKGELDLKKLQADQLQQALFPKLTEKISGALSTQFRYSGLGTQWPILRDQLSMDGDFSLVKGKIQNSKIAHSIAKTLDAEELKDFVFKDLSGNFRVSEGDILLDSSLDGRDVAITSKGKIGLDSTLDMPMTLKLSSELSEKLQKKASISKYLADKEGRTVVQLTMAGTLDKPKPVLDTKAVQKKLQDTLMEKALKEIDRSKKRAGDKEEQSKEADEPDLEEAGKAILKGIFGK